MLSRRMTFFSEDGDSHIRIEVRGVWYDLAILARLPS